MAIKSKSGKKEAEISPNASKGFKVKIFEIKDNVTDSNYTVIALKSAFRSYGEALRWAIEEIEK